MPIHPLDRNSYTPPEEGPLFSRAESPAEAFLGPTQLDHPSSRQPRPLHPPVEEEPRFTDFKLIQKLGEGAMGAVWKAYQVSARRTVALKVILPHLAKTDRLVERFYLEARTLGLLDHPNLTMAYAVAEEHGSHYCAMEYVDGRSLQAWLADMGCLPVRDALFVIRACARGLGYAHDLGLVHRDIKPANILITRAGQVKVADFGVVKHLDDDLAISPSGAESGPWYRMPTPHVLEAGFDNPDSRAAEPALTRTGIGMGTPFYMPLEQIYDAKHTDCRSDIYALGCTLYCLLVGHPPFHDPTLAKLVQAQALGDFPPARHYNPSVPERLDQIIEKMVAKFPRDRYQSCADVIKDIEALGLASDKLGFIAAAKADSQDLAPKEAELERLPTKISLPHPLGPPPSPAMEGKNDEPPTAQKNQARKRRQPSTRCPPTTAAAWRETVVEAAISGAMIGILVGMSVGLLTGMREVSSVVNPETGLVEPIQNPTGMIVGGIGGMVLGFIAGFATGSAAGMLVGLVKPILAVLETRPIVGDIFIGAFVGYFVSRREFLLALVGAFLGAAASHFGPKVRDFFFRLID